MDDNRILLQQAVAEFIGPFALVFLGAGSIIMSGCENLIAIGLAHGAGNRPDDHDRHLRDGSGHR